MGVAVAPPLLRVCIIPRMNSLVPPPMIKAQKRYHPDLRKTPVFPLPGVSSRNSRPSSCNEQVLPGHGSASAPIGVGARGAGEGAGDSRWPSERQEDREHAFVAGV